MKITTAELITRLADKGYTKKDSTVIVNDLLDVIYEAIGNGEDVSIVGFGKFQIYNIPPHQVRSVNTGELVMTKPCRRVKFIPGSALLRVAAGEARVK